VPVERVAEPDVHIQRYLQVRRELHARLQWQGVRRRRLWRIVRRLFWWLMHRRAVHLPIWRTVPPGHLLCHGADVLSRQLHHLPAGGHAV
jgi:hypothetical protein